jgi:signal transduction histidine kinase/DNA-binding response OmpR family regulator
MGKQDDVPASRDAALSFLVAPGELGGLIGAFDWAATPLGPLASWPQSLRTSVSLILNTRHPMWIGWGLEATFLYNDAYIDVLGAAKHPWALGRPAAEVWSEIWDVCGPMAAKVFDRAEATFVDAVQLFMRRGDFLEETWYSFSYSPILDEGGRVGGLFCPSLDISGSTLNARRLATLSRLSADALREHTVAAACATAIGILADNPADLPFALLYLASSDGSSARLEQAAGLAPGVAPGLIRLDAAQHGEIFPVSIVMASGEAALAALPDLPGIPPGLAGQRVAQALALPLATPGHERPVGVLVLGVSPVRRLDPEYRTFFDLVAGQVAAAIQNAGASEEQRRRADMLAELDRAKTDFFSNVSHEFRTPLTLMLAPIEDALTDVLQPLAGSQRERVELIRRNALRLEKLVNTLLDFSRVQAGRMQASFVQVDLPALTADLASGFRSVVESAGLSFEVRCAPLSLPARIDVAMWEKIVLNLLSNAFKFTFEGGITVTLEQVGQQAVLCVADTGIGIEPAHLDKVFERFQRVAGARSRSYEGSGIGLALVRDLVEQQGGRIEVASSPGQGSVFSVTLPLAQPGAAHAPNADSALPAPVVPNARTVAAFAIEASRWLGAEGGQEHAPEVAPAPALEGALAAAPAAARVLVADDNADMREYLARLLGQHWQVELAADGVQALEAARRNPPDVVVSDVMMPRLDGFGLIAALRADPGLAELPVLLLSARAGEEARIEGLEAGANDYLVKPFAARELVTRIDSQLIHARIRAVERAHAGRLAAIFRQAPVGIGILRGPDHVYELANDNYEALVGRRGIVGLPIAEALPELAGQGIFELLDGVRASGTAYVGRSRRIEVARGVGGATEEGWFDFVYQPMLDEDGAVESIVVVVTDVTDLVRARRDAEVANSAKDEFLAMLGHELRNPLAPILIALELIRVRRVVGAERELAIIERQAQHLVRLVDDLLDVARIARGKIELRPERVELAHLVALAVEATAPLIAERRHQLLIETPAQGLAVDADPVRLTQVISNLLTNAAKYTNNGGRVRVCARAEDGQAVLEVEDNGIGISPEMLPRLFDRFTQERQALDRSRGGLGLGLAIVREIVQLHGGLAAARSDGEGRGSTFEVRLPLAPAGSTAGAGAVCAADGSGEPCCRVLLVDDNPDVLDALSTLLAVKGHEVTALPDPHAALALPEAYAPEVALLDIGLPGMSGYELVAALKGRPGFAATDFVALSGYGQPEDRARSEAAGFSAHLVKPPVAQELIGLLAALGQRRRARASSSALAPIA